MLCSHRAGVVSAPTGDVCRVQVRSAAPPAASSGAGSGRFVGRFATETATCRLRHALTHLPNVSASCVLAGPRPWLAPNISNATGQSTDRVSPAPIEFLGRAR